MSLRKITKELRNNAAPVVDGSYLCPLNKDAEKFLIENNCIQEDDDGYFIEYKNKDGSYSRISLVIINERPS